MSDIFQKLLIIGLTLGTVTGAHMYNDGYMSIEGVNNGGKQFTLSLCIKEEEKEDGN